MVKSQAQFKRVNAILKKLLITHFVHIPILELKIRKYFPLGQNVRGIWIELNRLALVILLDNDISDSPKNSLRCVSSADLNSFFLCALTLFAAFINSL